MTKTDINRLLYEIEKENITYGLILKIQYIYGRVIGDVLKLKKEDIDLERNVIKFKLTKANLTLPIVPDIATQLVNHINGLNENQDYLFFKDEVEYRNINGLTKKINYYMINKIHDLNKNNDVRLPSITTKELKILRGQHLLLEGVPLKIIHELYNNFNIGDTRDYIDYDKINQAYNRDTVDNVIKHHTDLNLFKDESYSVDYIYHVSDYNDDYGVVEFIPGGIIVHEESNVTDRLSEMNTKRILDDIKNLNYGEYKFAHGFKFTRL